MRLIEQLRDFLSRGGTGRKLAGFGTPALIALVVVAQMSFGGEEPDATRGERL